MKSVFLNNSSFTADKFTLAKDNQVDMQHPETIPTVHDRNIHGN